MLSFLSIDYFGRYMYLWNRTEVFVKWSRDKSVNTLEMGHFQNGLKKISSALESNGFWSFFKIKKKEWKWTWKA